MIRVFETMGTVASLEVLGSGEIDLEPLFRSFDARFSRYNPSSELSRVVAGEISLLDASQELRDAYAAAVSWRGLTNGAFTPHRPDGSIDLDGIVKALAMDAAAGTLHEAGIDDWTLNVGGDVLSSGTGRENLVGVVDPAKRTRLLTAVRLGPERAAAATSGIAERGNHIWGRSRQFAQVTVVAGDIVTADVLATAIIAGGRDTLNHATEKWPIDVLAIDNEGNLVATPGMRAAIRAAEPDGLESARGTEP